MSQNLDVRPVATGWFDRAKEYFNPTTIMKKTGVTWNVIFECLVALGIGFLVGYLARRYAFWIALSVATVLLLVFLDHSGYISIFVNWDQVYQTVGIERPESQAALLTALWGYMLEHIAFSLSACAGILIGLRLG